MEEIEVGEYVRTPNNGIFIISHINLDFDDSSINKVMLCQNERVSFTSIDIIKKLKHSKNIIDLIEVGDYVNGKLIHHTDIRKNSAYIYYGNGKTFVDYQIKSIVTKEQFADIEYKLEDK